VWGGSVDGEGERRRQAQQRGLRWVDTTYTPNVLYTVVSATDRLRPVRRKTTENVPAPPGGAPPHLVPFNVHNSPQSTPTLPATSTGSRSLLDDSAHHPPRRFRSTAHTPAATRPMRRRLLHVPFGAHRNHASSTVPLFVRPNLAELNSTHHRWVGFFAL